jgi:nicotinamidase-related amidase
LFITITCGADFLTVGLAPLLDTAYRCQITAAMPSPRTALLVIDVEVFFRPTAVQALPQIKTLLSYSSSNVSGPLIFTQHGHTKVELTSSPSPSQLVRKWGADGSIAEGSEEWCLLEKLIDWVPEADGATIEGGKTGIESTARRGKKNTYDAFINTNLAAILEEEQVERVIVTGFMVTICPLQVLMSCICYRC